MPRFRYSNGEPGTPGTGVPGPRSAWNTAGAVPTHPHFLQDIYTCFSQNRTFLWISTIWPLTRRWLAESEILIGTHVRTDCEEFGTYFQCVTSQTTQESKVRREYLEGGVILWNGARLTNGLRGTVLSQPVDVKVPTLEERQLSILPHTGARYELPGICFLSPFADDGEKWHFYCGNQPPLTFKFKNEKKRAAFASLAESVIASEKEARNTTFRAYILVLFLPFLCAAVLAWLLSVVFKVVRPTTP